MDGEDPASMDPERHLVEDPQPVPMGPVLSVASGLIIATNLLVAAALTRLLMKRRSQSWCFVLNLAVADALVGVAITGVATEDFHRDRLAEAPANATARAKSRCLVRMAFLASPCSASILSMFLISLDRYAAIKMPLRYSLLAGRSRATAALLTLWIGAATLGFAPVMVQQLQSKRRYDGYCAFFSVIDEVGIIALFSACFFPVFSLFVLIYLDILKIACGHHKQILRDRRASGRGAEPQAAAAAAGRSSACGHLKALRTVGVLVGCFLLLWCPFFLVCVAHILCERCGLKDDLEGALFLLGLSNSLVNPLVYAFWQHEVRLQLAAIFSCAWGRGHVAAEGRRQRADTLSPAPVANPPATSNL
ncbi:unnamed protein product [Ophioblennius macclurei]